jgi:voltage-gated potassium channel
LRERQDQAGPYQLFMLVLCIVVLVALAVEAAADLDEETRRILMVFDTVVSIIFLGDFARSLLRAPDRRRYLLTWGWIDFISSIPSVAVLRWGRTARIARILRVIRGLRSARLIGAVILRRRAESAFLAASLVALLTLFVGSIAVLRVERPAGGNIQTAGDALWWAMATMSTAGFGDLFPTTGEGRAIAAILMFAGIGLFGAFTGLFASWILGEPPKTGGAQRSP